MTRKDYQIIATMVGDMGRSVDSDTFREILTIAVRHMKGTGNFNEDRFILWASEVASALRDVNGNRR